MARLNAIEFARSVQNACHESAHVLSYNVQILDDTVVKIRVVISGEAFVEVFYNADSGKCSYALIQQNRRIFGADNAFIGGIYILLAIQSNMMFVQKFLLKNFYVWLRRNFSNSHM